MRKVSDYVLGQLIGEGSGYQDWQARHTQVEQSKRRVRSYLVRTEGEVMQRLLVVLDDMRRALGSDRVYDVIGEIIPAPKFDALMKDWLSRRRTMTEILAEIDLQTDEEQVRRIRADMQDTAVGFRYIDMSKLTADVQQSRENRLMPEYIEKFFVEAWR